MTNASQRGRKSKAQRARGYAYIMALGMVLVVIAGSQAVLRNMVTEARSQREQDMIWRGNQYVRAIRAYYRKTGHYPQTQDDLNTGVADLHFLRSEAMKDPMNKQDGSWRFIYGNATGAIIGSVKYGSLQQMALMDMNGGVMPGAQNSGDNTGDSNDQNSGQGSTQNSNGANGTNSSGNSASGNPLGGSQGGLFGLGSQSGGQGNNGPAQNGPAFTGGLLAAGAGNGLAAAQPTGPVDGPQFGDQLIGVASTVDATGVRVYKGETKYKNWEFIWNPIEEQARAVSQGLQGGGAVGVGLPGLPVGATGAPGGPGTTPLTAPGGTMNPPGTNSPTQ